MLSTGRQIKAARALLGWSQQHLADKAALSVITITRMEKSVSLRGHHDTVSRIQFALESAGIEFLNSGSPGVRAKPGVIVREEE